MRDGDVERVLKEVFRKYKEPNGSGMYIFERHIKAVLQAAIDLEIVALTGKPAVRPYSEQ